MNQYDHTQPFQAEAWRWICATFPAGDALMPKERMFRLLEEVIELAQSLGIEPFEIGQLVGYTYSREIGDPAKEIGGVMNTLAGVASSLKVDMMQAGITEIERCWPQSNRIRSKWDLKPIKASPIPAQPKQHDPEPDGLMPSVYTPPPFDPIDRVQDQGYPFDTDKYDPTGN